MKRYKEHTYTYTSKKVIGAVCDWCMEKMTPQETNNVKTDIEWKHDLPYDNSIGGDAYGWTIEDLCVDCATKLRDLLIEQGINLKTYEYDY